MDNSTSLYPITYSKLINSFSVSLMEAESEQEIYTILASGIKQLLPKTYFLITKLQKDDMNFRIIESNIFNEVRIFIKNIGGKDPILLDFPFKDLTDEQTKAFEHKEIYTFTGGIHDLSNGALNQTVSRMLEKLFGIAKICGMSLSVGKNYFGSIILLLPASNEKSNILNEEIRSLIEIISNHASTVIQKFRDKDEIKKNEIQLQEQTTQLKELNKTKDRLFSIIAHDLKSPFNSLLGFTDLLINDYKSFSNEERLSFINLIKDSTQNMYNLLENLLDWSSTQNGHLDLSKERFGLREFVTESIQPYDIQLKMKEIITFNNIDENIFITANKNSIKTVIRNLFINAIKYTKSGGEIKFDAIPKLEKVELNIIDTGIGMTKETINKLFRIDTSYSSPGTNNELGTGLGLIICKELIDKNNGEISVESEINKGTVFKILLPTT